MLRTKTRIPKQQNKNNNKQQKVKKAKVQHKTIRKQHTTKKSFPQIVSQQATPSTSLFVNKNNNLLFPSQQTILMGPTLFKSKHHFTPFTVQRNAFSTATTAVDNIDVTRPQSDPQITQLFKMLDDGLQNMLPSNEGMTLVHDGDKYELTLPGDRGTYHFDRDPNEDFLLKQNTNQIKGIEGPIVYMMSPISGACYRYHFDKKRFNNWVSIDDEHYMVELLTRELLKVCYGFPMF